jgi:hypothetical protein
MFRAVGTVSSARDEVLDDDWADVDAVITLHPPFDERSVQGLDAIDGTPVLDIKPYMEEFGSARPRAPTGVVARAHVRLLLRKPP